jgi:hypothetical protein
MQAIRQPSVQHQMRTVWISALASLALVIPFVGLEYAQSRGFSSMPFTLFVVMWLLPLAFFIVLTPLLQRPWLVTHDRINGLGLLFRVAILVALAGFWFSLVNDQMPCFMGTPNCD